VKLYRTLTRNNVCIFSKIQWRSPVQHAGGLYDERGGDCALRENGMGLLRTETECQSTETS